MSQHRTTTNRNVDAAVFKRTAISTKKVNINPKQMRGGIRF